MNRLALTLVLVLAPAAQTASPSAEREIASVLDGWHAAAARADEEAYFAALSPEAVFLGTDGSERWDKAAFRAYAHPYFAKKKAWTFVPHDRHVTVGPDGQTAWFDEALDSAPYGACRGSGVLVRRGGRWLIAQYNLSLPVPNAVTRQVVGLIRAGAAPAH